MDEYFLKKICVHCKATVWKGEAFRLPQGGKRWCCKKCYKERYAK